jgi:hypothetical protein
VFLSPFKGQEKAERLKSEHTRATSHPLGSPKQTLVLVKTCGPNSNSACVHQDSSRRPFETETGLLEHVETLERKKRGTRHRVFWLERIERVCE